MFDWVSTTPLSMHRFFLIQDTEGATGGVL